MSSFAKPSKQSTGMNGRKSILHPERLKNIKTIKQLKKKTSLCEHIPELWFANKQKTNTEYWPDKDSIYVVPQFGWIS